MLFIPSTLPILAFIENPIPIYCFSASHKHLATHVARCGVLEKKEKEKKNPISKSHLIFKTHIFLAKGMAFIIEEALSKYILDT